MDAITRMQVDAYITFFYNMDILLTQMESELKRFKAMREQVKSLDLVSYRSPLAGNGTSHGNHVNGDEAMLNAICRQETQKDGIDARIAWLTNRMSQKLKACNIIEEILEGYNQSHRSILEMYYKEYVERVRTQNAASERRRRAAKDDEIAELKAQIAALQAKQND